MIHYMVPKVMIALTGGDGFDTFVVNKNANTTDTITDFKVGVDRLILAEFLVLNVLIYDKMDKIPYCL